MVNNSWKLCKKHANCGKCSYTLSCWKNKASKHSHIASALKYVNMCLINGNNEINDYEYDEEEQLINELEKLNISEGVGEELPQKCGICLENYRTLGEKQMIVFNCGHSTCITCFNGFIEHNCINCPYCKKKIKRAIKLFIS